MKNLIDIKRFENFALYELGGDKEMTQELSSIFLSQISDLISIPLNELNAISRAAHKLKSSALSFGALSLADLLNIIEAAAKGGEAADMAKLISQVREQNLILQKELFELMNKIFNNDQSK